MNRADTNYTFGDNTVAVAEGGNQSSPGTGDSGTAMEWNDISSRGRSSASNRSSRATSKRSQPQRGHRTPRRATTRSGTPKAIEDRSTRTRDIPGKRKTEGPDHETTMKAAHDEVLEFQGEYEIEMMTNHLLEERIEQLEDVVASRNQVINGIEVKFTDYLRGCNESVNSEFSTLDGRLSRSTAEVHKGISSRTHGFRPRRRRFYYAHRRAGAQEESGRERCTEDLRQGHDHEGRVPGPGSEPPKVVGQH